MKVSLRATASGARFPVFLALAFLVLPVGAYAQVAVRASVLDSLQSHANALLSDKNHGAAIQLLDSALVLCRQHFPDDHSRLIGLLNEKAKSHSATRAYQQAAEALMESRDLSARIFGKTSMEYYRPTYALANVYDDWGKYADAEPLFLESKAILLSQPVRSDSLYVRFLNTMGVYYLNTPHKDKVEAAFLEAKSLWEKSLNTDDAAYAQLLNNLGHHYTVMGQYEKAEQIQLECLALRERLHGKKHGLYAQTLLNLARAYQYLGKKAEAEPLLLDALAIRREENPVDSARLAIVLDNLGVLYREFARFDEAEKYLKEGTDLRLAYLGSDHPHVAFSVHNLATLYVKMGRHQDALPYFEQALQIRRTILGANNEDYLWTIRQLADLHNRLGHFVLADSMLIEVAAIQARLLNDGVRFLSEQELLDYSLTFQKNHDLALSFAKRRDKPSSSLAAICYDNSLLLKGFLSNAVGQLRRLTRVNKAANEKYQALTAKKDTLSKEYAKPIGNRSGNLLQWEDEANTLEKELARSVPGYAEAIASVAWNDVQARLRPHEAAVEFVRHQVNFPNRNDSVLYAALILRPGYTAPRFVSLFEERDIAPLIRGASGKADRRINALYAPIGGSQLLYDLVWKPLDEYLQGVKTVYCSPSGLLYRLNLNALSGQSREVVTVGSTRSLVLPDKTARTSKEACLVGGVRYTTDTTALAAANQHLAERDWSALNTVPFHADSTRGDNWDYLPNTAAEVLEIQKTLRSARWNIQLDTGYLAIEEVVRSLGIGKPAPRVLHIATHGFFFPDPNGERVSGEPQPAFKNSDHPMIRSGLLLAGAKDAWSGIKPPENREDGILTAYEISQMNLSNTELVVLSACETGLGDIEGNEGVYGLQRAFKIAGAKYLLMSLWKVNDLTTRELMTDFYKLWLVNGLEIPAAFRAAQGKMQQKYPNAPYLWAGFVLVE
ncbi:MAG: CHAT domain-containing tetratricopeptide repeat protein [Saprospiraceae bacterium]